MTVQRDVWQVELADWPGHTITVFDCAFPESVDGGADVVLPVTCAAHTRSVYWCLNTGVLWCDGGPPRWVWHVWPGGEA